MDVLPIGGTEWMAWEFTVLLRIVYNLQLRNGLFLEFSTLILLVRDGNKLQSIKLQRGSSYWFGFFFSEYQKGKCLFRERDASSVIGNSLGNLTA